MRAKKARSPSDVDSDEDDDADGEDDDDENDAPKSGRKRKAPVKKATGKNSSSIGQCFMDGF